MAISAGEDTSSLARARVVLEATAPSGGGVASYQWVQVAGPAVELEPVPGGAPGAIGFLAPDVDSAVELEARGLSSTGSVLGADAVVVTVEAPRPELLVESLSSLDLGGAGHARASAYHAASQRLFVIDAALEQVAVFDVADPSEPIPVGAVVAPPPVLGFTPGPPLAVACGEVGSVIVTWSGETTEFPGRVQFVEPLTLTPELEVSSFGSNPVDVDVTPDGRTVAVACAGDPPFVGGGEGLAYVTIFRVPASGPALLNQTTDVAPIPFISFDGDESALAAAGVRWFDSGSPQASLELTPRAVALSPDGTRAWAACPENDALVLIDTELELATDCLPLEDRAWGTFAAGAAAEGARLVWEAPPAQLTTLAGDPIPVGGFTGITGVEDVGDGRLQVTVIDGAGPVLAPVDVDGDLELELPMVAPDQPLRLRTVELDPATGAVTLVGEQPLFGPGGEPVVGRPSLFAASAGLALQDEPTVDLSGNSVAASDLGARFCGGAGIPSGGFWLADSRRAGLWRFDAAGALVSRFVPTGTPAGLGDPTLPPVYAARRANLDFGLGRRFGGFGALAFDEAQDLLTAAVRLPLDNPDTADDAGSATSLIVRLLQVDGSTGAPVGEYALVLDALDHSIEGLCLSTSGAFGGLAVLEAAATDDGFRGVYALDLAGATNLQALGPVEYAAVSAALEGAAPGELASLPVPVVPVTKTLRVDLTEAGLGGSGRVSGLAALGEDLVVSFDNGAGLDGASAAPGSGVLLGVGGPAPAFARVSVRPEGLDASSVAGPFDPRPLPIEGLIQPLDLVAFDDRGETRLALANGGLARVVPGGPGGPAFDERLRVGDLTLDTQVFPGALGLQQPEQAGDLQVSSIGSDGDGDGLVDRLLAFGARSVGVRDASGVEVWSSGESLVRRTATLDPAAQRAAATMGGPRPLSLALGEAGGAPFLAVALEGPGAVAALDLTNPSAPLFAGWLTGAGAAAEVDAAGDLVIVTEPSLGRVTLLRVSRR